MSSATAETLAEFQERLGYRFSDRELLARALTHKSYTNERRETGSVNNERLEFLGDTVLGFVIGELIFRSFPALQEGALSKIKAHLVSAATLSEKARALGIGRFLRMGTGEARSGGAEKLSLLADGFEAVVAAIYLDGGLPAAEAFTRRVFGPDVSGIDVGDLSFHDYKTALQETAQALGLPLPDYRIVDEYGPDHEKTFVVEVAWDGTPFAYGRGASKREAQRKAAKEALKKLGRLPS
jgi:ribonuclease-3